MGREPGAGGVTPLPFGARAFDARLHAVVRPIAERASRPVSARLAQFAAGRACAREALRDLRAAGPLPLGVGPLGAPVWPRGFVGSISHTSSLACAVVAREARARGVGVDIEHVVRAAAVDAVAATTLDAHEAAMLPSAEAVTIAFSAKESVLKCLSPIAGVRFDFCDARVVELARGRFRVVVLRDLGPGVARGLVLTGRFALADGVVVTSVVLPA